MKYDFSVIKSPTLQRSQSESQIQLPEHTYAANNTSPIFNKKECCVNNSIITHAKKIGLNYAPWWLHECFQEKNSHIGFKS